jgi:tetratricopeptide (TPR) repeat protein
VAYDPRVRNRARAMAIVSSVLALLPIAAYAAGETSARPQVRVIPPPQSGKEPVEPDDLPGPPLEVAAGASNIRLPAVPDFASKPGGKIAARELAPPPPAPAVAVVTQAPMRKIVGTAAHNLSIDALNKCNDAINARRYQIAVSACQSAIEAWDGNHLAWYAKGNAHIARDEYAAAVTALEHAVTLRPDVAMYQMAFGIAQYESEVARVREERARRDHTPGGAAPGNPRDKNDDAGEAPVIKLDGARAALVRATTIAPVLWRAHGYLGFIYRDLRDPRAAAEELTLAIKTNPAYRSAYIALTELYRRWAFREQALAVASLGTIHVPRATTADLWFEVGICHEEMHNNDEAIEAYSKALALTPDAPILRLHRGWLYYVKRNPAAAKRDLEGIAATTDPRQAAVKQAAEMILAQISAGLLPEKAYRTCKALNGCTVFRIPNFDWLGDDWSTL